MDLLKGARGNCLQCLRSRCRVEDTRLEAKAKNTKKNSRSRPRTALPRTDPLKAKGRNARGQDQVTRTQAQVFSKKKAFKNFFMRSPNEENKHGLRKFSLRFLAFSYIILKMNNSLLFRNQCKCASHYVGILRHKPSRRGSASVLC